MTKDWYHVTYLTLFIIFLPFLKGSQGGVLFLPFSILSTSEVG